MTLVREMLRLLAAMNARRREDVSLAALAALSHRSPFNLHRRFVTVVGETPKAYTTRVRLDRAAADLLATDRQIAAIAFDHGFASHEVFTRAFTRQFGVSPRTYRARGLRVDDDRAVAIHADAVTSVAPCVGLYRMTVLERSTPLPVDIVVKDLPPTHALVMRRRIARDEIAATLSTMLPALFAHAQRGGVAITGPPFARYPEFGMGTLVIEGGITTAEAAPGDADAGIEALTIPAGQAAVAHPPRPVRQPAGDLSGDRGLGPGRGPDRGRAAVGDLPDRPWRAPRPRDLGDGGRPADHRQAGMTGCLVRCLPEAWARP